MVSSRRIVEVMQHLFAVHDSAVASQLCSGLLRLVDIPSEDKTGCAGFHRALCLPVSVPGFARSRPVGYQKRRRASSNAWTKRPDVAGIDALADIRSDLGRYAAV